MTLWVSNLPSFHTKIGFLALWVLGYLDIPIIFIIWHALIQKLALWVLGWMVMVVIIEYHMAHVTRRPNTNMPNLVWLVVVVIKHISYIIWPMRRPNTNMLISVWMDVDGGHY